MRERLEIISGGTSCIYGAVVVSGADAFILKPNFHRLPARRRRQI